MPEFEICFEEIVIPFDYTRKFSYELAVRAWKNSETGKEGKRKLQIRSLWNPEDGEKNIRNVSTFGDELKDIAPLLNDPMQVPRIRDELIRAVQILLDRERNRSQEMAREVSTSRFSMLKISFPLDP